MINLFPDRGIMIQLMDLTSGGINLTISDRRGFDCRFFVRNVQPLNKYLGISARFPL